MNRRSSFGDPAVLGSLGDRAALPAVARRVVASSARAIADGRNLSDDAARLGIAAIDWLLSSQLDAIFHHTAFQSLESAWRGFAFVVSRTDFAENIRIEMVSCSKEDLRADFMRDGSGLTAIVSSEEPFAALVSNYDFDLSPPDIALLRRCASVAAAAQAPFLAAAAPSFFGLKKLMELPQVPGFRPMFEDSRYAEYKAFRDEADARYVGLFVPRFLLRLPFGGDTTEMPFEYEEDIDYTQEGCSWGNATFAFATRLTDSFAKYRWFTSVLGPTDGVVEGTLPIHTYGMDTRTLTQLPIEAALWERQQFELAEEGFIGLTFRKSSGELCFLSARSVHKPKYFGASEDGIELERNYRRMAELPFLFIACRIAHYLQTIHRQYASIWRDRIEIELQIGRWLEGITRDARGNGTPDYYTSHPLRKSNIDFDPRSDAFRVRIRMGWSYEGRFPSLTIEGRLAGLPAGATARREGKPLSPVDFIAFPLSDQRECRFKRYPFFLEVQAVFDSDDDTLVLASSDGKARVFSTQSWTLTRELPGPRFSGWSTIVARRGKLAATSGDREHRAGFWQLDAQGNVTLTEEKGSRTGIRAFGPDRWLGVRYDGSSDPWSVVLVDPHTGESRVLHQGEVTSSAMSPDGSLVVLSTDARLVFKDTASGEILRTAPSHSATALAFRGDGRVVASGAGTISLWDTATGVLLRVLGDQPSPVLDLAFSPDGDTLASVSDDHVVRLWSSSTGSLLHELRGHVPFLSCQPFSRDGALFVTQSTSDPIELWSVKTGVRLAILGAFNEGYVLVAAGGSFKLSGDPGDSLWFFAEGRRIELAEVPHLRMAEDAPLRL